MSNLFTRSNPWLIVIAVLAIAYNVILSIGIHIKIDGEEALRIAESDTRISKFVELRFREPKTRVNTVKLIWNEMDNGYYWEIEFMERRCACEGIDTLNVAVAKVSPYTGRILDRFFRENITETSYGKEKCMKKCHANYTSPSE